MSTILKPKRFSAEQVNSKLRRWTSLAFYQVNDHYNCLTLDEWSVVFEATALAPDELPDDELADCTYHTNLFHAKVLVLYLVNGVFRCFDWNTHHAYNILLPHDGERLLTPRIYEPQDGELKKKGVGLYKASYGVMI